MLTKFLTNLTKRLFKQPTTNLGRWNLKDNSDLKATIANMDSCGDSLCGNPASYTHTVNYILKRPK
tara:strand:+ start:306 stop:503 length:198 start_codon:yes stop_codon:yes gene_type:complete